MLSMEVRGSGKSVLVLHGLLADHRQMLPLLPALENHEVFFVDLLGHGQSSKEPSTRIIDDNVAELKKLCSKHHIHTVIAYSVSGLIALELALPNTILISSFCTNPMKEGPMAKLFAHVDEMKHIAYTHNKQFQKVLTKYLHADKVMPGASEASVECAIHYLLACEHDYGHFAKQLKNVIVLHGTHDKLIDYKLGVALAEKAHAPVVLVPESHFTVLKNETVHNTIKQFLSGPAFRGG